MMLIRVSPFGRESVIALIILAYWLKQVKKMRKTQWV